MKVKDNKINNDNNYNIDLNERKTMEQILNYARHGFKASDKHGHCRQIQAKCHPAMGDVFDSLFSKAPKGYWTSHGQMVRSIYSVGAYVIGKVIEQADNIPELKAEFEIVNTLNEISKKRRAKELKEEARGLIKIVGKPEIDDLENLLELVKKIDKEMG